MVYTHTQTQGVRLTREIEAADLAYT
jgi:hypothetical protein